MTSPTEPLERWYTPRSSPITRFITVGSVALMSAGVAGYIYLVDPNNPANAYPKCPMKALTGLDCPGCGGLRATNAMLHGDIGAAVDHNVLALVIVPVLAYLLVRWMAGQFGKQLPAIRLPSWGSWAVPAFMLAFTILRSVGPFRYLASETY
jgi:hypothetical protein